MYINIPKVIIFINTPMGAMGYSGLIRLVLTYMRLLKRFHPDSFKTERIDFV